MRPTPEDHVPSDQIPEPSLFLEFDDLASRYLNTQNSAYRQVREEGIADYKLEMFRRKSLLETLRLGTSWFLEMLDLSRQRDWYVADRTRLARHAVLLALYPETYDSPGTRMGGWLTRSLLQERKTISQEYPHLYDPRCWGVAPADGTDLPDLKDDLAKLDRKCLNKHEFDTALNKMAASVMLFDMVRVVHPSYLEESLAIQNEIDLVFEEVSDEGAGIRQEMASLLEQRDPGSISALQRFVIESLIFRFMLEEGVDRTEEIAGRWIDVKRSAGNSLRPFSREDAERSLDLLEVLFDGPDPSCIRMMAAAQATADLGDANSSWNMIEAVLHRCQGTDIWNVMAFKGAVIQMSFTDGRHEELSRTILANGEERKDAALIATGLMALTLSMHRLGRSAESEKYHERMMSALLSGHEDPDILGLYPLAASQCLGRNAKQDIRRLASAGLKAMAEYGMDNLREQLIEIRRRAGQVNGRKGVVHITMFKSHK